MHEAKTEGDDPAARKTHGDDVLEGHIDDRDRDQRLDQGRKPLRVRRIVVGGGDQRDRMGNSESSYDRDQRAQPAERDDKTEQEQEVVGAVEDVAEAEFDEAESRLTPFRIEPDEARVAFELVGPYHTAGVQESERRNLFQRELVECGMDRESRAIRLDGILEEHVEYALLPVNRRFIPERGTREVRQRLLVSPEGAIGVERHARRNDVGIRQQRLAFVDLHVVR